MVKHPSQSLTSEVQKVNISTIALFGEVLADVFPDRTVLGGAPYNVARHLQAFGQHPVLITRTGNDALREEFLAEMTRLGMDSLGVQCDPVYPTGQVTVNMEEDGHRFDICPNQAYDHIHSGVTHLVTMSTHPDMVYFGTLAQRGLESRHALDTFLCDAKCPRFLDLNLRQPWYDAHMIKRSLLRADILKINEEELAIIASLLRIPGNDSKEQGLYLIKKFDLSSLYVTCGAAGAWMLSEDGSGAQAAVQHLEGFLVDTVGAGDGFSAVCMMGNLRGWPADVILQRANAFGSALCGIRGAAPEHQDFYMPFIKKWGL